MMTALCPGSYDPVTMGHMDIIRRSAAIFDQVVVLVLQNRIKTPTFTVDERVELVRRATSDLPNVRVDKSSGLLVDYAKDHDIRIMVKGLRAVTDFEDEFQQALINRKLNPQLETVFMSCASHYMYLSSSMVRQIAAEGRDISEFVPAELCDDIMKRLYKPDEKR